MSADEEFEETVTHGEGGQEEGAAVAAGAPGGARGETPSGSPWWKEWCARIGAGEEGLDATRTTLALQLQAQDHAERLARDARAERVAVSAAQQAAYDTQLALRDRQIEDLRREFKALKDQEEDREPEHREFCPRSLENPFGIVVGSERSGTKAEPSLWHYGGEKAFSYLEENGGKEFYNFQCLESAAEAMFDVLAHLKVTFPIVIEKVNPDGLVDEADPAYVAERELS
jgi:hypothetical protein